MAPVSKFGPLPIDNGLPFMCEARWYFTALFVEHLVAGMFAVSLVHFISQLIFHAFISTVFSIGIIILFWLVLISFH